MRAYAAAMLWTVMACASPNTTSESPGQDALISSTDAMEGDVALEVLDDLSAPDLMEEDGDATYLEVTDDALADVPSTDGAEDADVDPYSDVVNQVLLTDPSGETVFMDASYTGYEAYIFGAEVYGDLLKLWASEGDTKLELLIRLDQAELPGSITPGPPGESAWALLLLGDGDAYVTQFASGTIEVDACPESAGQLLTGQFDGIPMYSMSGLSTANFKISGTFELLLGSVNGATYCAP